jgi:uncharacterized membrane protein (DUF485 family)
MPVWLWVTQFLWLIVAPLVKTVFRAIGLGFVTYFGFNVLINAARDYMITNMGDTGLVIQQILGLAKVDIAINIMLSAVFTRFVIAGIDKIQDKRRNQVWRAPGGTSIEA